MSEDGRILAGKIDFYQTPLINPHLNPHQTISKQLTMSTSEDSVPSGKLIMQSFRYQPCFCLHCDDSKLGEWIFW